MLRELRACRARAYQPPRSLRPRCRLELRALLLLMMMMELLGLLGLLGLRPVPMLVPMLVLAHAQWCCRPAPASGEHSGWRSVRRPQWPWPLGRPPAQAG